MVKKYKYRVKISKEKLQKKNYIFKKQLYKNVFISIFHLVSNKLS